ncbi:MAG: branched-chain amino acid ABC transporter permease [Thermoleophilia bacterium]|nr:branched-chain amino acid ABC transporter permease [Thermoleophilia bacterium]
MNMKTYKTYVGAALLFILFALLATLPVITQGYIVTLLTDILKFVILTVAWVLFSAPTGYMSLATAAFYGLGFYMAALLSGKLPFLGILVMAGVAAFFLALIVGVITLRLRGVYFTIFTFGLVLLILYVVQEIERILSKTRGRFVHTEPTEIVYWAMFALCVITIVVAVLIRRSRHGLALQSIGEYEEAAEHCGINVVRTKVLVFALSSIFMAMAGAIIATRRAYVDPGVAFDLNQSFLPVLMALFGGMYNLVGPVIGAAIFAYLSEILLTRFPDLFMLLFGLIMVLAIAFLPNGVSGLAQQAWRKLRGGARAPA